MGRPLLKIDDQNFKDQIALMTLQPGSSVSKVSIEQKIAYSAVKRWHDDLLERHYRGEPLPKLDTGIPLDEARKQIKELLACGEYINGYPIPEC